MKHILLITLISMGLSIGLAAKTGYQNTESKTMSDKQIKRMDRKHNRNKAQKRDFRTQKEYKHKTDRKYSKYLDRPGRYNGGHHSNRSSYSDHHRRDRQRGYRHGKKGWKLAYRYDRAFFYDSEGYHYGYFNRYGYFFEGIFYRYDRYYAYKDRVKGRGLFDHRYYMPANYRYYGFSRSPYNY